MSAINPVLTDPPCELSDVLEYRCPKVLQVFRRHFYVNENEAGEIFVETLKWLWLGRTHQLDPSADKPPSLCIFPALLVIDEMWHCFILCTREYSDFCSKYFGKYIHHSPHTEGEGTASRDDLAGNVSYVIYKLGRSTALLWYGNYQSRYTEDWFRQNRVQ